jgi:hypothetical protein
MTRKTRDVRQYVELPAIVLALPLAPGTAIEKPERLILTLDGHSLDLGALCFLRRGERRRGRNNKILRPTPVDPSSLSPERVGSVKRLIKFFSDRLADDGYRPASIIGQFSTLKRFIDWCDSKGHNGALTGGPETYAAYKDFVDYLRESIRNNSMRRAHAWDLQLGVEKILRDFLNVHDLLRGVNRIYHPKGDDTPTEPPDETALAKASALSEAVFLGFTDFVVRKLPYPYKLALPLYLGWEDNWLWIFPDQQWCVPPTLREKVSASQRKNRNYNYVEGRLITDEEATLIYKTPSRGRQELKRATENIARANRESHHHSRIQVAIKAHNAFVNLFMTQTGVTLQIARDLRWSEENEYSVGAIQQGFREIKWRANGKEIHIVLRSQFLPLFRKYLSLRSAMLGKRRFPYLFLTFGVNFNEPPSKMTTGVITSVFDTLHRIDPSITRITARALRSAKQDFHITRDDPTIAAAILAHSESTARRHYSAGTKSTHYEQITTFLGKVKQAAIHRIVILRRTSNNNCRDSDVGGCQKYGSPASLDASAPIRPDCTKPEGCLFCTEYRVHADELDLRKLASCAYVVERTINAPGAGVYFEPVLERIREILDEVTSRGRGALVTRILHEVNVEGKLSPYWEEKLTLLEELEIAS